MRGERARWVWAGLAALLAAGAAQVTLGGSPALFAALDWQPALAAREPWRWWSAALVHYSTLHLVADLAGAALVAAFGLAARVPWRSVFAWALAWPATQLGLLAQPELLYYGGLSGVLHAGVACVAVHLAVSRQGARRVVGLAVLAGLAAKVVLETPWGAALRHPPGWDIAIAPFAHAAGALAGTLIAAIGEGAAARQRRSIASR